MSRVAVYVDGFNLYHGLKAKHGRRYLWLDVEAVSKHLLRAGQALSVVKYFTAHVRNDPQGLARQRAYIAALQASGVVDVTLGRYQEKHPTCRNCGANWTTYEEKETDVNIAVSLLEDAVAGIFNTAVVISADSDLCPAIRAMRRVQPAARVVVVFPPRRRSDDLRRTADAAFTLGDAIIRNSQLSALVTDAQGNSYTRPATWR